MWPTSTLRSGGPSALGRRRRVQPRTGLVQNQATTLDVARPLPDRSRRGLPCDRSRRPAAHVTTLASTADHGGPTALAGPDQRRAITVGSASPKKIGMWTSSRTGKAMSVSTLRAKMVESWRPNVSD
jgi:hypothetical protein